MDVHNCKKGFLTEKPKIFIRTFAIRICLFQLRLGPFLKILAFMFFLFFSFIQLQLKEMAGVVWGPTFPKVCS